MWIVPIFSAVLGLEEMWVKCSAQSLAHCGCLINEEEHYEKNRKKEFRSRAPIHLYDKITTSKDRLLKEMSVEFSTE